MIPKNLLIINYHKIETKSDIGITTRHPNDFKNDLLELRNQGFQSINFNHLLYEKNIPDKPVIISFDDAYLSFYEHALEILLNNAMTAVVFVPVNFIGKYNDWDVQFFNKKYRHLSAEQLKEIAEKNIEIGSHTLNHKYLNDLSEADLDRELGGSKELLKEIIKTSVNTLSYPFGQFNNRVIKATAKYYDFGVQLLPSLFKKNINHKLTLERVNVYRTDSRKAFSRKLNYHNNPGIIAKNRLIQKGAWATILLNKVVGK